jgi:1,4-alpha-glucan branching enzyme
MSNTKKTNTTKTKLNTTKSNIAPAMSVATSDQNSNQNDTIHTQDPTTQKSLDNVLEFLKPHPATNEWLKRDPYLEPYSRVLKERKNNTDKLRARLLHFGSHINQTERSPKTLRDFANGHHYYGLHLLNNGWVFREWAPNATKITIFGDMTNWQIKNEYSLTRINERGDWEIQLPQNAIAHGQQYRLLVEWPGGSGERVPAWTQRALQDPNTLSFNAQVWQPIKPYKWCHKFDPTSIKVPFIYEAHVGLAQEETRVGTYNEFTSNVLPRIKDAGYNTIQLMAVQEHPYYGSFGYQISSFFAPSSRFGTPDDLKNLIDTAHSYGIAVIMDIVHSHAVKNSIEGISVFDGTEYQYFHAGDRGSHIAWDSRCFNYAKYETIHFLLSNCRYWLEEFHFDGFRFDGVTSMLYHDHGLGKVFSSYEQYFDYNVDNEALSYLMLATLVCKECNPKALLIAEDVSGMPGLAVPNSQGGIGFDYRFAMGVPDHWIKLTKDQRDEDWHMGGLWHELVNRRNDEKTISYAESHDQAIVGDQSLIFRLIGPEIYTQMRLQDNSLSVERGIALHKMIRLITAATAGNGYMTFIGNEFGHPEWIDFPRAGNNWSYHYARRQWSLANNPDLYYSRLLKFDHDMVTLLKNNHILEVPEIYLRKIHEDDKVLAFERGDFLFIFNFHPYKSLVDYPINTFHPAYSLTLDTDQALYGGHERLIPNQRFIAFKNDAWENYIKVYLPARSGLVIKAAQ